MKKIPPMLSNSFRETLKIIENKYSSVIAKYILDVDFIIQQYNNLTRAIVLKNSCEKYQDLLYELHECKLLQLITNEVSMLNLKDNFEISFLPKGKPAIYRGSKWGTANRQSGKPIKIIKKLIKSKEFTDRDYEIFHNQLKAELFSNFDFELVSGKDITFWYNKRNYYDQNMGTLGKSCMKDKITPNFFKLYEENAKMLILKQDNKLIGRAIVWEKNNEFYMDRIYTYKDHLYVVFCNYATANNWYIREDNQASSFSTKQFINYNTMNSKTLSIELKSRLLEIPYMDSLQVYDFKELTISSVYKNGYPLLTSVNGHNTYDPFVKHCRYCGRLFFTDGIHSRYIKSYDTCACDECVVYSKLEKEYIAKHNCITLITNNGKVCVSKHYPKITIDEEFYSLDYSFTKEQLQQLNLSWLV